MGVLFCGALLWEIIFFVEGFPMKRYCVERVIGDDELVLGVYDGREEMLQWLEANL